MISALDILSSHAAAQRRADKVRARVRVTRVRVRVTLTLTTLTPTRRETASGSLWLLGRTAGEEVANSNPNPDPYPDPDPNPTVTLTLTSRPDAPAEGAETHASKPSPQQRAWQGEQQDRARDSLVATAPRST